MIMTKKIFILAITSLLALCHVQQAAAKYIREYTTEKPLIIVSDWEFPPYEFRNDMGEPDGYNVGTSVQRLSTGTRPTLSTV